MNLTESFRNFAPDPLYRFTAFFPQFLQAHGEPHEKDDVIIMPTLFNKNTRTYQWLGIDSEMWDVSPGSEGLKRIKVILEETIKWKFKSPTNRKRWKNLKSELPTEFERYNQAWELFDAMSLTSLRSIPDKSFATYHRALLLLYSGYQQHALKNVEGVYFRMLKKCKNKHHFTHDPLVGYLMKGKEESIEYDWFVFDDYHISPCDKNCEFKDKCICEIKYPDFKKGGLYPVVKEVDEIVVIDKADDLSCCVDRRECKFERCHSLHNEKVSSVFIEKVKTTKERKPGPYKTLVNDIWLKGLLTYRGNNNNSILIVPIYDVGIHSKGYGGIKGILTFYFRNDELRDTWYRTNWQNEGPQRLGWVMPLLSHELQASAEILASTRSVRPPYDLISHFLSSLIAVQDWEKAIVVDDGKPVFSYVRKKIENSYRWGWVRDDSCPAILSNLVPVEEGSPLYETEFQHALRQKRKKARNDLFKKEKSCTDIRCIHPPVFQTDEIFYLWWPEDFWNKDLIPTFQYQEINRYRGISICFQFPTYYVIPEEIEDQKIFVNSYLRQQIDLMRILVPKLQARHAALRSAVAAIMGRNMSHNLGSHVLSYWIRKQSGYNKSEGMILTLLEKFKNNNLISSDFRELLSAYENSKLRDEESRLLFSYLRNRMDFIAEIATTDQPAWSSSMMFCKDILIPFLRQTALLDYLGRSENVHFTSCSKLGGCEEGSVHSLLSFEVFRKIKEGEKEQIFGWKSQIEKKRPGGPPRQVIGTHWYNPRQKQYESYSPNIFSFPREYDVEVAVPHSLTGLHALYCILENFIRNCVKHGGHREGKEFIVQILLDDREPDMVRLEIVDPGQLFSSESGLRQRLIENLNQPLVDGKGEITRSNWGLKEMKIAACYLRQGRSDLLDEEENFQPDWLKTAWDKPYLLPRDTMCEEIPGFNRSFGYTIYLLKPKEAALLKPVANAIDSIEMIESDDLITRYSHHGLPHRLLFYDGEDVEQRMIVASNAFLLPLRIVPEIPSTGQLPFKTWIKHLLSRWRLTVQEKSPVPRITILYRHFGAREQINWEDKSTGYLIRYSEKQFIPALEPGEMLILFDEHGDCLKTDKDTGVKPSSEQLLYYQAITGGKPSKQLLTELQQMDEPAKDLRLNELLESAMTQIVVADERIWETFQPSRKILQRIGITVVPVENKQLNYAELSNIVHKVFPDFVIVHQGLLDKMNIQERTKIPAMISQCNAVFVIASGRGIPHSMIQGARFLEISTLETILAEEDKFSLTQILYSLRRPSHA